MARYVAFALLVVLTACRSSADIEPAVTTSSRAPITLTVNEIHESIEASPPASGTFKDRRRSARLGEAAKSFLQTRLLAGGGSGTLNAVVTEATVIEHPRAKTSGFMDFFVSEPDADFEAELAVRLSITDGLGVETAFAEVKVARTRAVPEGLDVIEQDAISEALINDLLRQLDEQLTNTANDDLAAYKAF
ncbi:MAG: hypothetical protein R3D03_06240 [Geminicoccaceae bacterium]|nr:hypothetical protein [Geminicoccaceae bacterium]